MANPILQAALDYRKAGLSPIPTSLKTKAPAVPWKIYQERQATEGELRELFKKPDALGIVTGKVSGNLELIDFDNKAELFSVWSEIIGRDAPGLLERLLIQKSQSDGRHAAYRCPGTGIPGNTKLAQRGVDVTAKVLEKLQALKIDPQDKQAISKALPSIKFNLAGKDYEPHLIGGRFVCIITLIETRGEGGQFLAEPSPGYKVIQGIFTYVPEITAEERQILIEAARSLNEWVDPQKAEGYGRRIPKEAQKPGDDFNERGDIAEILIKHGWEQAGARANYQHFRRPGKNRGQSASLIDGRLFYVFSSNAYPFESETTYSPFAVYAHLECEGEFIKAAGELAKLGYGGGPQPTNPAARKTSTHTANWALAARLFPRIPFPWEVLPSDISDSLQQLGRACATSPYSLPGAAFCQVSSITGRTLSVSPKNGWEAPLIIWHLDIRESGEGKTPSVRLMARPIHEAQKKEQKRFEEELATYNRIPRKDRDQSPAPTPPRGYFVSDLTLEGLREDLVNSPHGGLVVIQDEISAFLNGQNQYKQKGTDREAWLSLHDGHPTRIVRAGKNVFLDGARVSIFGGIQPRVFKTFFAGENGLYLSDGTLFRFLATCEPSSYFDLTKESWEDQHRGQWEKLLSRAMEWVETKIYARGGRVEKPIPMILDSGAQGKFFEWRNQLHSFKDQLPAQLRGFVPKAVEYVLRLTGVIHCMHQFSIGKTPQAILAVNDLERGIKAVSFYMGQIQDALRLIEEEDYSPPEISERSLLLANTLEQLRSHSENGRLAISFIQEQYNKIAPKTQEMGTARAMGGLLRAVRLSIPPGKHDANGRRAAKCLEWDQKTETFIKQCLLSLQQEEPLEWRGFGDADIQRPKSAMSAIPAEPIEGAHTLQTSEKQCLREETCAIGGQKDIADVADFDVREVQF